ncbi:MAG TPA: hypothetical protein VH988_34690 [Thermoanaerobaculia bacterium]|nr:hypothetical protein [Thermoanaerobaculia bacterium]
MRDRHLFKVFRSSCLPTSSPAKALELFSQWLPIGRVKAPLRFLLIAQRPLEPAVREIPGGRQLQEWSFPGQFFHDIGMSSSRLDHLGAQLGEGGLKAIKIGGGPAAEPDPDRG